MKNDLIKREPWKFVLWMGATLGLYSFYVVPQLAKAVNRLLQKDKFNSTFVFWIGVVTLGLGLSVFEVFFAYQLEKNPAYTQGKWNNRRLCVWVLILNLVTWILAFVPRGEAFIGSIVFGVSATLLIQHEINQYVDMNGSKIDVADERTRSGHNGGEDGL
jgi:hypothetical protein